MCTHLRRRGRLFAALVLAVSTGLPGVLGAHSGHGLLLPGLAEVLPTLSFADESELFETGQVLRFHPDGVSPGLLPNVMLSAESARQIILADLNIGIEGLFFTPLPDLPPFYSLLDPADRMLLLYNILRSVSTLTGVEYYSASRERMRILFQESWVIADPGKPREALPDPFVHTVPPDDTVIIHQRDKSFASNQSTMRFRAEPYAFSAVIVNLSPMRYKGILRVVDPGDMQTHLIVVPVREGLLVYGTMSAKTRNVKAFISRARDSFTNRVTALTGWYKARVGEEFGG